MVKRLSQATTNLHGVKGQGIKSPCLLFHQLDKTMTRKEGRAGNTNLEEKTGSKVYLFRNGFEKGWERMVQFVLSGGQDT